MGFRVVVLAVALATSMASGVQAGGLTFAAPGAVPMGRGGAAIARGEGAITAWLNPALLADVGLPELEIGVNLPIYEPCITRSGTYGSNVPGTDTNNDRISEFGRFGDLRDEPFPTVCADGGRPAVIPYLMTSLRLHDDVGIGFGVFPPLGTPALEWGRTVTNDSGRVLPNPIRYNYAEQRSRLIRGVLSVGWRARPWLALGAGFVYGATLVDTTVHQVFFGGESPALDLESNVSSRDRFIPGVVLSAQANPHPNFDVAVFFHYLDTSRGDATLNLTWGTFGTSEPGSSVPQSVRATGVEVITPQPMQLRLALRYADRRSPERSERRDPLADERWDIELVIGYERNARMDEFVVKVPSGNLIDIVSRDATTGEEQGLYGQEVRTETRIPKGFRDQLELYLGSDVAVVPDRFALRAGLSFESRGMDPELAQSDFMPGRRFGIHAGLTLRLGPIDITAAYMHVFQEDLVAETGALVQPVSIGRGQVVNAGRYEMRFDAVSIAITGRR